jgi:hypothetical protein
MNRRKLANRTRGVRKWARVGDRRVRLNDGQVYHLLSEPKGFVTLCGIEMPWDIRQGRSIVGAAWCLPCSNKAKESKA